MQEPIWLGPGECYWNRVVGSQLRTRLTLNYTVPIFGHVSVWLDQPRSLIEGESAKIAWQIPVSNLLRFADVSTIF